MYLKSIADTLEASWIKDNLVGEFRWFPAEGESKQMKAVKVSICEFEN